MDDLISRQAAIDVLKAMAVPRYLDAACEDIWERDRTLDNAIDVMRALPSAQPEQLTDKEQRIFLAAMGREENVCKEVDAEMTREPYEDSLVRVCHEIIRKVKGALWRPENGSQKKGS